MARDRGHGGAGIGRREVGRSRELPRSDALLRISTVEKAKPTGDDSSPVSFSLRVRIQGDACSNEMSTGSIVSLTPYPCSDGGLRKRDRGRIREVAQGQRSAGGEWNRESKNASDALVGKRFLPNLRQGTPNEGAAEVLADRMETCVLSRKAPAAQRGAKPPSESGGWGPTALKKCRHADITIPSFS